MLFNSFEYLVFLPIVFLLYWFVFDYALRGCKRQLLWHGCVKQSQFFRRGVSQCLIHRPMYP